ARQAHQEFIGTTALQYVEALLDAHRGNVERAKRGAELGLAESRRGGLVYDEAADLAVLGFLALSLGDAREAQRHLGEASALYDQLGFRDPSAVRYQPDLIEALIDLGRLDEAEAMLASLEEMARALDRPWALAASARCRGMLHASRGEIDAAGAALDEALREHDRFGQPFD